MENTMTRSIGRPTKYSPDLGAAIAASIAAGLPKKHAAMRHGIGYETLNAWLHGRGIPKAEFPQFVQAITQAVGQAVVRMVGLVVEAAQADPRHAEWRLARVHPADFGGAAPAASTGDEEAGDLTFRLTVIHQGPRDDLDGD